MFSLVLPAVFHPEAVRSAVRFADSLSALVLMPNMLFHDAGIISDENVGDWCGESQ